MYRNIDESKRQPGDIGIANEKMPWQKPALEEFAIGSVTRNASIINLDADHALDIS